MNTYEILKRDYEKLERKYGALVDAINDFRHYLYENEDFHSVEVLDEKLRPLLGESDG